MFKIEIPCESSYMTGRNGTFEIKQLVIRELSSCVLIGGQGKSGKVLNGGIYLDKDAFKMLLNECRTLDL